MKLIRQRQRVEAVTYSYYFQQTGAYSGTGFSFPCDEHGNIDIDSLSDCARKNYIALTSGEKKGYDPPEVTECKWTYVDEAMGHCDDCGEEVYLGKWTNTCDCGADYDMGGHRLAPREQWGDDTGESLSDILGPGDDFETRWDC